MICGPLWQSWLRCVTSDQKVRGSRPILIGNSGDHGQYVSSHKFFTSNKKTIVLKIHQFKTPENLQDRTVSTTLSSHHQLNG